MARIFNFIVLVGITILQILPGRTFGNEISPYPSPAASPQMTTSLVPEVPLSERKDIILVSKFYQGMNEDNVPKGWELDDKKKPIDISLKKEEEQFAVRLRSENSAFGIYRELKFNIRDYPFLNWEWKVEELPKGGSFLKKDKDDQAAQVYVSFGSLSFFNKPFVKAVGYYWSSTLPVGTEGECPTWSKSRVIVLQTGEEKLGKWISEKRNVYEDYKRLFDDDDPSKVSALRLYTNSQHTGTGTKAFFRNIYFSKR